MLSIINKDVRDIYKGCDLKKGDKCKGCPLNYNIDVYIQDECTSYYVPMCDLLYTIDADYTASKMIELVGKKPDEDEDYDRCN